MCTKSNLQRLREAQEAVRKDEKYRRERSRPANDTHSEFIVDTSPGSEFRRYNPGWDDGHHRGSENG